MVDPLSTLENLSVQQAEAASRNWWILLLYGLVSVAVGLFIFSYDWTLNGLAAFIGAFLIIEGIFTAASPGMGALRTWNIGAGVLGIIVGIAVLVWPDRTLFILGELVGAWVVVRGLFNIVTSIVSRHLVPYWWILLLLGIVEVPIGLWLMRRPGLSLYLIVILAGIWLVVLGTLQVALAFEVKNLPRYLARLTGRRSPIDSTASTSTTAGSPL